MSLLTSPRDSEGAVGWRLVLTTSAALCFLPATLGLVLREILIQLPPDGPGRMTHIALATFAGYSPIVTLPFWIVITLATLWGLRHGLWGALSAALVGAMAGGAAGAALTSDIFGAPMLILAGAALATLHRYILALLRPLAF
ncbi:hypothetical protein [Pseudogemmobacter sonorensis]|uniref:hypothetical protein n=1 Tax=Pseudogemmobacter sonorensis TaxID=2989681 RepID=UPI0036D101E3